MMRMLFAMMDSDGNGTAHCRSSGGSRAHIQGDGRQQRWQAHAGGDRQRVCARSSTQIRPSLQFSANNAILKLRPKAYPF